MGIGYVWIIHLRCSLQPSLPNTAAVLFDTAFSLSPNDVGYGEDSAGSTLPLAPLLPFHLNPAWSSLGAPPSFSIPRLPILIPLLLSLWDHPLNPTYRCILLRACTWLWRLFSFLNKQGILNIILNNCCSCQPAVLIIANLYSFPPQTIDNWMDGYLVTISISAKPPESSSFLQYLCLVLSVTHNTPGPVWLHCDWEFWIH